MQMEVWWQRFAGLRAEVKTPARSACASRTVTYAYRYITGAYAHARTTIRAPPPNFSCGKLAMGKRQSKLSHEELRELTQNTHCKYTELGF